MASYTATVKGTQKLYGFYGNGNGATYTITVTNGTGAMKKFDVIRRPIRGGIPNVVQTGYSGTAVTYTENARFDFELEIWADVTTAGTFTATVTSSAGGDNITMATLATDPLTGMATSLATTDGGRLRIFPASLRVCLVGDSITEQNTSAGSTIFHNYGYWTYAAQILKKQYVYANADNYGVAGYKTQDVIDNKLAAAMASNADIAVVLIGTNDVGNSIPLATIKSNLLTIWRKLRNSGKTVIAGTIFPRNDAAIQTSARRRTLMELNAWIRQVVPTLQGVYLWDSFALLADLTTTDPNPVAALFQDSLHPNRGGASIAGAELAATFNRIFGNPLSSEFASPSLSDLFEATFAPTGNMVGNSTLAGTGTATSWTIVRSLGSTVGNTPALQSVPLSSGQSYNKQRITIAGSVAGIAVEEIQFRQNVFPSGGFAIGDIVSGGCNFNIVSNTNKLLYVGVMLQSQFGAYQLATDNIRQVGATAVGGSIPITYSGSLQIPDMTLLEAGSGMQIAISIGVDCSAATGAAGSTVVEFDSPYIRRISRSVS